MIRKAIIPCAGHGTRMLPVSSAVPKELLPIGVLPIFHFVLSEVAAAGIETVVLVTASWKTSLERYLHPDAELLDTLERTGKLELVASILRLREKLEIVPVLQGKSLGLGHAIGCAGSIVGDDPFAVLLPDELILQSPPTLSTLIAASDRQRGAIALLEVPKPDVKLYGIAELASDGSDKIVKLVEKPDPSETSSQLAVVGRYVFPAGFQRALRNLQPGRGGELQLTDAMQSGLDAYPLMGIPVTGQRFDTGNPEAYGATWNAYLQNPEPFHRFITECES